MPTIPRKRSSFWLRPGIRAASTLATSGPGFAEPTEAIASSLTAVGIRTRIRILERAAYFTQLRAGDHEYRVDDPGPEGVNGIQACSRQQMRGGVVDPVGREERERNRSSATALRSDRQSSSAQLAQVSRPLGSAREDPDRLEVHAGEGYERIRFRRRRHPPCTKAMSTPPLGSSSRWMFSTEPEVSRASSVMPSLANRSQYISADR